MEVRLSAHGAYQHQFHVVWIPKYRRRILRGSMESFVQEYLPQIQHYHPDVTVQEYSVPVDHIQVVMVIPPKYAVSSIVGKMKAKLSRQLRLRYPELKRTCLGAVQWTPGFFSSTVGLNEAVTVNQFTSDTKGELELVEQACADHGVKMALANHWAEGGAGAVCLAETVREVIEKEPADFRVLYPDTIPLAEKLRIIWQKNCESSPGKSTGLRMWRFRRPSTPVLPNSKTMGMAISPFVWRRRSTAFPPILPKKGSLPDLLFRFGRFVSRWARGLSWSLPGT